MTQAEITTIKNSGVALPKTWQGSRVFVRITDDSATITKVPSSKKVFNGSEIKSLRRLGSKISPSILNKALKNARR